jgi:hypothetical protein
LLASAGEQGLTRDKVLAFLWPDAEEERSRRMLNQRGSTRCARISVPMTSSLGTRELRFNPDLVSSDVAEFEEAVSRGKLEDAAARYTGPFLDGFRLPGAPEFDRWAERGAKPAWPGVIPNLSRNWPAARRTSETGPRLSNGGGKRLPRIHSTAGSRYG